MLVTVDVALENAVEVTDEVALVVSVDVSVEVAVEVNAGGLPHVSCPYAPVASNSIRLIFATCFEQSPNVGAAPFFPLPARKWLFSHSTAESRSPVVTVLVMVVLAVVVPVVVSVVGTRHAPLV